jgi:PAS domain S-box-containing protein
MSASAQASPESPKQRGLKQQEIMAKILIVDDDPATRQLYVSLLTPFGHQVNEARDGEEGLAAARNLVPALVISDILMPTMNGYQFVSQLRQFAGFETVPVIFQSASFLDHETQTLGRACGVSDFISKPCEPEEILGTVNRALGIPLQLPMPGRSAGTPNDPVPMLIDAFYEKGKQFDALSLRLAALLELGLDLSRSSDPQRLLEHAVSAARKIIGANYAGAGTVSNGDPLLRSFATSGIDQAVVSKVGRPALAGSFREIAVDGETIRAFSHDQELSRLALPANHPAVHGFLGVPVPTVTRNYGLIYVANKLSGAEFSLEDLRFLITIAAKLAVAYENALRYQEIQERTAKLEYEVAQRKQAEDRFRLLIETAPTGILICDEKGRITEGNSQLQRMFGYAREELVGQDVEMLVPEQHRGSHVGHRKGYVSSPQTRPMGVGMELRGRRKDGTTFPLEISLGPLVTGEGTWISSTVVDISERKKLEQQLQVSQRLESVGQLAAGIAHDFNNILTAITGNAKLALTDLPANHPVHENLAEIQKASLRATQLVRQILTFGRQEAPKRQVIKLAPVVEEALKLLRAALRAGIEIRTHFEDGLPDVLADLTQVHQIIMNLGTNAADAMGKLQAGVLEIRSESVHVDADLARATPDLHEGAYVRLSIRDTGSGMDKATTARIFEPFYTTKPQGEGTGLGLSVVHGIVKTHGGAITVYSEPGKGTVFQMYLPAAQEAAKETRQPQTQGELRGHGERVLYVDDEEPLVFLMTRMLTQLGYTVTGCTEPQKALEVFRSSPQDFDVVVSDLSMPQMSGVDLAREILQTRPGMPILIASGYIRPEDNEGVRSLGLPDLLLKPDTIEELSQSLHDVFVRRKSSAIPESSDPRGSSDRSVDRARGADA